MKNSLKLAVFAIAATAAFSAGAATSAGSAPAIGRTVYVSIDNNTGGCVRVYANGQFDLQAHTSTLAGLIPNRNYMASVFKGRCGGAAVKNVWYTAPNASPTQWKIR